MRSLTRPSAHAFLPALVVMVTATIAVAAPPADSVDFFESRIRPVLIEHCYACHSSETEDAGGLLLDSRQGWQTGGDSGPPIRPGDPETSRLLKVISYTDAELEMPPDGKLPEEVIADIRSWIEAGAIDPREEASTPGKRRDASEIDWEAAREHWAYAPRLAAQPPPVADEHRQAGRLRNPIDAFILRRLDEAALQPSQPAGRHALVRRLAADLTGLPPTEAMIRQYVEATDEPAGYERLVDTLIASHDFSIRMARHWLDVARYAESVTLRGLVQPEAWRYRQYVIDALHRDRSWREVIREQIAGDLIDYDSPEDRRWAQIAVTFLCMGDSNLEAQQKRQLEMDYIDEQLETVGRALLGQTIGCARCHDHKFDPIPTSDYYAMAGILHGSVGIEHANVSRWIENPLPLDPAQEAEFAAAEQQLQEVKQETQRLKKQLDSLETPAAERVASSSLPGVVVDDVEARRVGSWKESSHTRPFVDAGYIHDENQGRGEKSLTFEPVDLPPGNYELRVSYSFSGNRSSKVLLTIFHADGETTVGVNQRTKPEIDGLWDSLGRYRFEPGGQAFVMLSNEGADGHVIGDAIHFLPIDGDLADSDAATQESEEDSEAARQIESLKSQLKQLGSRQSALEQTLAQRPQAMGLKPRDDAGDLPIHIRGSIHTLGEQVPRGALRVASDPQSPLTIAEDSCGRLELADWIADDHNPLTARVLVNRVWLWVMGQGLVRTPDNFGTTGQPPTHPELLDWLSERFVEENWSIKRLVKRIVMSATYRQVSQIPATGDPRLTSDPDNRLWWRADRKPLSAEALRDSVLALSGRLDRAPQDSILRPGTRADYGYQHDELARSIYLPVLRNAIPDLLTAFNYTDTSFVTGQRQRGIVAHQALALLNHPWFAERAIDAARRNLRDVDADLPGRVEAAFLQTLARPPHEAEQQAAINLIDDITLAGQQAAGKPRAGDESLQQALAELYLGLWASSEFRLPE